jgi:microcystin-dependent protein
MNNYLGEIKLFAGNFVPEGWHLCDGTQLEISRYRDLFELIGTTYGGDGQEHFALPDLRGRVPLGAGTLQNGATYKLAQKDGQLTVKLNSDQMPPHNHSFNASTDKADTSDPKGAFLAAPESTGYPDVSMYITSPASEPNTILDEATALSQGGGQEHNNLMPYLCCSYIIALTGGLPLS